MNPMSVKPGTKKKNAPPSQMRYLLGKAITWTPSGARRGKKDLVIVVKKIQEEGVKVASTVI